MTTPLWDERMLSALHAVAKRSFGRETLYSFQQDVAMRLIKMVKNRDDAYPSAFLLVVPTGGGKSLTRDLVARALCGVTWTFTPLLSLSADQTSKLVVLSSKSDDDHFFAYHLDEMDENEIAALQSHLMEVSVNTRNCVSVFSSPQRIKDSKAARALYHTVVSQGLLSMICLDELHMLLLHGLQFRVIVSEVLKDIFDPLHVKNGTPRPNELKIPVLCMTATADKTMITEWMPLVTGLSILTSKNVHWPFAAEMNRRSVFFHLKYIERGTQHFKDTIGPNKFLQNNKQSIFYTTFPSRAEQVTIDLKKWMDKHNLPGDVVAVHGKLDKEQKFYYTRLFTGTQDSSADPTFKCLILVATNAANAGIDLSEVYFVFREGFPPTSFDLLQELGRAGRRPSASPATDKCTVGISLWSYNKSIELLHLHSDSKGLLNCRASASLGLAQLHKMLSILVAPKQCYHLTFEELGANPFVNAAPAECVPCLIACSFCKASEPKLKSIKRKGATNLLITLFRTIGSAATASIPDELPKLIQGINNCNKILFANTRSSTPPKLPLIKTFVLQLLAAGILEPVLFTEPALPQIFQKGCKPIVRTKLTKVGALDDQLAIYQDSFWTSIKHVTD
jgi:superfamily II DNA helicase RecQ